MSIIFNNDNFKEKALELLKISKRLNDNWKINEVNDETFLSKKQIITIATNKKEAQIDNEDSSAAAQILEDIYSIEYHVVFHPAYQVPVLYFNAYKDDGKLVNLEDVSKIFVQDYETKELSHEIYKVISQADHPILLRPFYMIHPCHIHEVLSKFPESKNYILTFLTIFGPFVRLKMNEDYEKYYN